MSKDRPAGSPARSAWTAALQRLYRESGSPSEHDLAQQIGRRRISQSTIREILRGGRLAGWPKVRLLIDALGGDIGQFEKLWRENETVSAPPPDSAVHNSDVSRMITSYRSVRHSPRDRRTEAAEGPVDLTAETARVWSVIQQLSDMSAGDAANALRDLPDRQAALVLADLPKAHARRTARALGENGLERLIEVLPPSEPRDRLAAMRPPRAEVPHPRSRSAVEEVAYIMLHRPDLARYYRWIPDPDASGPEPE